MVLHDLLQRFKWLGRVTTWSHELCLPLLAAYTLSFVLGGVSHLVGFALIDLQASQVSQYLRIQAYELVGHVPLVSLILLVRKNTEPRKLLVSRWNPETSTYEMIFDDLLVHLR